MSGTERLNAALAGRYKIEKQLGQGGMATVYLAQDVKHDRKVAVKVLKPELAAVLGAERFVVEIKTTAALQHPHILPLFDSGTADGFLYYVMPYIEGETLRGKLNREKQFGIDEAVRITTQVADALDYAHRQGVIHRDIKPENILLHDGRPMVADFGIALAVSAAAGGRMTETGLSLGTPHYMSPEQATAEKEITGRSDIYSLASVLYEMLTGEPPHMGHSAQQIIMKIITDTARPVTELRKSVPPNVAAAVAKALEKLPADRFETAKQFAEALVNRTFTSATGAGVPVSGLRSPVSSLPFVVASAVAVIATVAALWGWMRRTPEPPFRRFDLSLGGLQPSSNIDIAISPDGTMLAVSARDSGIYIRHLDGDPDFRKLTGGDGGIFPAFSPDNKWLVFTRIRDLALVKVSVDGGGSVTLVPGGKSIVPILAHWGTRDKIVFGSAGGGTYTIAPDGGTPVPVPKVSTARIRFLLPDGSGILYSQGGQVRLYDFKTDSSVVLRAGLDAMYISTGHITYLGEDGGVFAIPFDLSSHRVTGSPIRVLERVGAGSASRGYSVSASGTLVQFDAPSSQSSGAITQLVILEPGRGADTVRLPSARHQFPRFSPDGHKLAFEVFPPSRNGQSDIYTVDLVTGTYTQLTFDGDNDEPVWSPDGKRILFDRVSTNPQGEDLYIKAADNSGPEQRITTMGSREVKAEQWLDDKTIVFGAVVPGTEEDVFVMGADSGSVPKAVIQSPFREDEAHISPDRKWIAYTTYETAGNQIRMRDYPVPQGKWNVSAGAGLASRWSPDGRYIYFWRGGTPYDSLFRARIDRTPSIVVRSPEFVMAMDVTGPQNWDFHPDGRRIVVVLPVANAKTTEDKTRYLILENWFRELRRQTGAAK